MNVEPNNILAEKFVLGSIILESKNQRFISELCEDDFYEFKHKEIFKELNNNYQNGVTSDLIVLSKNPTLDLMYLMELTKSVNGSNENWISILKDCRIRRDLINEYQNKLKELYSEEKDPIEIINEVSLTHDMLRLSKKTNMVESNQDILDDVDKMILEAKNNDGISGAKITRVNSLDSALNGSEGGDLIVVAARPGMGKSILAVNTINGCIDNGMNVVVWSLEMLNKKYMRRVVANRSGFDFAKMVDGSFDISNLDYTNTKNEILSSKLKMISKTGVDVEEIRNEILRQHEIEKVDCLIIDYGGLVSHTIKGKSTNDQYAYTSKRLKQLAMEINAPIFLLWQLSRKVEERTIKIPQLSDLRDTGAIEQDADKIVFLYRPSYYGLQEEDKSEGATLFRIAKNRDGDSPKNVWAEFDQASLRFKDEDSDSGFGTLTQFNRGDIFF